MARIPESEVERLKQEISLQRLVEARGVELKRHGSDLRGLCPFHADTDPSLIVTPSKNLWHCLGACRTGGTVIDWVMKSEGVSFRHAVELLKEGAELSGSDFAGRPTRKNTTKKLPAPFETDSADYELLDQVVGYYHETLKQSPEALGYLESRGLVQPEMLTKFKLGFVNRTLGYRLPMKNRQAGAEIRSRLQELGILRESGHEHFNGSIVIPVFDENGPMAGMYGRKITNRLRKGTPLHLYLPGPHVGVWNIKALAASEEIILCESLIDALTFWCAGFRNVTSSYGIEGFTKYHLQAFEKHGIQRVLIAYDRDKAGDQAAEELSKKLINKGMDCFRVQFPKGMDANEYALKVTPAEKSLEVLLRNALWLGQGERPRHKGSFVLDDSVSEGINQGSEKSQRATKKGKTRERGDLVEGEETPAGPEALLEVQTPPIHLDADTQPAREPTPVHCKRLNQNEREQSSPDDDKTKKNGDQIEMRFGDRRWRVRGLAKNLSFDQMKVNVLVARLEDPSVDPSGVDSFHVDTFDLYSARHRSAFVKQAAEETQVKEGVIKKDLGKVLLKLEELQEKQIQAAMEPEVKEVELTEDEKAQALSLLKDPNLLERILGDFEKCGVVGEETNKLTGYLAAVSRKLEEPLAIVIQSSSAAGKSSLMEAVLAFVPEEQRVQYSAMTGQSLFYMGETDLQHKILAIVEEEGAERAGYALKILQSEGKLCIASTGKDPDTGRLVTHEYHVQGPVMIFLTTTAIEVDEELLNRCIVLTVDEGREQTKRIHELQRNRQTIEGLLARQDKEEILKVHQNAQRLLRPLLVANPYSPSLTFMDTQTRTRRDHMKYLTLIRSIALLHQYQRPMISTDHNGKNTQYIEASKEDIAVANNLVHEVLGRSLDDLAPQTRRILVLLDEMVTKRCEEQEIERCDLRFSRREIREFTSWSYDQVRVHVGRLVELEYLLVHSGGRGQSFVYELVYDGQAEDGKVHFMGLIDVEALGSDSTTTSLGGETQGFGGSLGAHLAPIGVPLGSVENPQKPNLDEDLEESLGKSPQKTVKGKRKTDRRTIHVDPNPPLPQRCLQSRTKSAGLAAKGNDY